MEAAQSEGDRIADTRQSSVELIVGAVTPSRTGEIQAALRFRLKDGWHIYWQNPGDSGGPPTIRWTLPSVTAGPFEWPTPEPEQRDLATAQPLWGANLLQFHKHLIRQTLLLRVGLGVELPCR